MGYEKKNTELNIDKPGNKRAVSNRNITNKKASYGKGNSLSKENKPREGNSLNKGKTHNKGNAAAPKAISKDILKLINDADGFDKKKNRRSENLSGFSYPEPDYEQEFLRERNALRSKDKGSNAGGDTGKSYSNAKFNSNKANHRNEESIKKDAARDKSSVKRGDCPYLKDCGGCNYLLQGYEAELKEKQKKVNDLIGSYCKVEPILGMKQPQHYRNKVHVVFDHDRKGNPISGVYQEGTHRVIPVDTCLIHNKKADEIIKSIRGMLKSFKIKTYDEDTGYGLLRHVMVRTGFASGEIMVVLVLSSPIMPSKNNFVKALRKLHPEITTIVLNVNDKDTSMVLGDKEQVIYGKGYIEDSLCSKVFRISAKSFYQVNPSQTEVLYGKAIEMAGLTGKETIIDAYCGIGTIGIIASGNANKVIGVELNKDAVKDAVINAKRNNAANIEFYQDDAGDFMSRMAADGRTADVVFMDPPRSGSNEKFLDALVLLKPKKVIYVSCNPITLERDLEYLKRKGYRANKAVPVDMFPWTGHVECVALIERK